ncbi:MAG: type II toxin-antitoxin system RelE/ParE family toxin [Pirellulaceae bacterium]|jgi:mRNA interferase RelE/StbE|nr:type II toxin-antitoxin system RelE/ParE family toxin [Pirellulaceae bacterium]
MDVTLTPDAAAELDALNEPIHARVLRILERLHRWPEVSGAKALSGSLAGCFRIRTGDYRVQFRVEGRTVVVEKIGHRDGFYEG